MSIIAHIEWAERHSRSVARNVGTIMLSAGSTVILELYSLIGNISCCRSHRVGGVLYFGFISFDWTPYCEKTDKDVVVAFVVILRSMSIVSMVAPAALVVISRVNGSPAVVTENVVPLPPTSAEGVIFSPVHLE